MRRVAAVVALVAAMPATAVACPTCVSSAFGDRTFNWAYLGLLLMPFALTAVVGGIVAYRMGWRPAIVQRLSSVTWRAGLSLVFDLSTRAGERRLSRKATRRST